MLASRGLSTDAAPGEGTHPLEAAGGGRSAGAGGRVQTHGTLCLGAAAPLPARQGEALTCIPVSLLARRRQEKGTQAHTCRPLEVNWSSSGVPEGLGWLSSRLSSCLR